MLAPAALGGDLVDEVPGVFVVVLAREVREERFEGRRAGAIERGEERAAAAEERVGEGRLAVLVELVRVGARGEERRDAGVGPFPRRDLGSGESLADRR